MNLEFTCISIFLIILQTITICYAFKLFRIVKQTKYWSSAWFLFTSIMFILMVRRILLGVQMAYRDHYPWWIMFDFGLQFFLGVGWFLFTFKIYKLFSFYFKKD